MCEARIAEGGIGEIRGVDSNEAEGDEDLEMMPASATENLAPDASSSTHSPSLMAGPSGDSAVCDRLRCPSP